LALIKEETFYNRDEIKIIHLNKCFITGSTKQSLFWREY